MFAQTHRHAALILALSTFAPACMAIGPSDEFADDLADADAGDDGRDSGETGGEGEDEGVGSTDLDCRPSDTDPNRPEGPDELCEPREPARPSECLPRLAQLIAGQHFGTGAVSISNDDDDSITVRVQAAAPYELVEVHVYIGTDPVPTNGDGAVAPGGFPYTHEFIEPGTEWSVAVPLAEIGAGCDDQLAVAVHAVVVSFEDGKEVFEETAWGFGDIEFEGSWGWAMNYGVCCE